MQVVTPPHSKESEMIVLGNLLSNPESLSIAIDSLEESHFYFTQHRTIFLSIKHLSDKAVDLHLIAEDLRNKQKLDEAGGVAYLTTLVQFAGTSAYIEEYIDILDGKMKLRKLLEVAKSIEKAALGGEQNADELAKQYRSSLDRLVGFETGLFIPPPYTCNDLLEDLSRTREGLKTGYPSLDEVVEIPQGAITLVAGRPSHGKTITQLNLLLKMVKLYPEMNFYFFSYEEPKSQILLKILNILAGDIIDEFHNLSNLEGYLRGGFQSRQKINAAIEELQSLTQTGRLVISDHSYFVDDLTSVIAKLKNTFEDKLGVVFIDYIQKIKIKHKYPSRQLELQKISSELLETAKSYHLPIVLGAQLGRGNGKKEVLRLDNLREAGDIENDAKLVIGIWNQAKEESDIREEAFKKSKVDLEFVILKNRNGPSNQSVFLEFDKPLSKLNEKEKTSARKDLYS